MIYTENVKRAMQLAYDAHHGQTDKGGMPYIFHPYAVADGMMDENSVIAALLHDVIEDCGEAYADIIRREFSAEIAEAVETLTKREDLAYDVYIEAVKNNPIARRVKIADLTHNMNLSRIGATEETLTEYQRERLEKYRHSLQYLLESPQEDRT